MKLDCTLLTKTSKKSGNPYVCIEIQLTDNYKKTVFLDPAENELCKNLLNGLVKESPDSPDTSPWDFK